jgi:uncharacterized membrane protein YkvA (DUF1232 family)
MRVLVRMGMVVHSKDLTELETGAILTWDNGHVTNGVRPGDYTKRPAFIARWRQAARQLKAETLALYYCIRDPRTPWYARLAGALVVAYAISPLDLIPDFVPVLGYLDDLILVPLGLWLTLKLIPPLVIADNRARARAAAAEHRQVSWIGAAVIILVWIAAIAITGLALLRLFHWHL